MTPRPKEQPSSTPRQRLARLTQGTRLVGYSIAALFFVGFGAWAALVPLAGAALAPGVVSPDGHRKTVQHLEGGIVKTIHVVEGQEVRRGDLLISLQDTKALGDYRELRERIVQLQAAEARLLAEQAGAETIAFPPDLRGTDPVSIEAVADQTALFGNRRAAFEGRSRILSQRIAQLNEENLGLEAVISALDEKQALIKREIADVDHLYQKGYARLPRLLELQRAQADIRAERASRKATIAGNLQKIGETEMQRLTLVEESRKDIGEELTQVRADVAATQSQLPSRADTLSRTMIAAPIDGRIMNVRVTTEAGGVIKPGEPLIDIVPQDGRLVIDARVKPVDIDSVSSGMTTRVLLTAYRQRAMPQIHGRVQSVSADRLVDDATGEAYFLARVVVSPDELSVVGKGIELLPGMPAEVLILTGERSLVDYLMQPLLESFTRSFREN